MMRHISNAIRLIKKFIFMPRDKAFNQTLRRLVIPMALQNFMMSSIFLFDAVIVGSLGDAYLGGAGQANQVTMIMWSGLYAASSAGAIYVAQFWGKNKDLHGIRKAFTVMVLSGCVIGTVFFVVSFFFRDNLMMILARDAEVRQIGSNYLSVLSFAYLLWMISAMLSSVLKAVSITRVPMIASALSIALNIILGIGLVHGIWIFPNMGIYGAALSTVIAAGVELVTLIVLARIIKAPIALRMRDFLRPDKLFLGKFIKAGLPLLAKDQLWAGGVAIYSICFASLGVAATAAYNIYGAMNGFMNIVFISVGASGGIVIGQMLGAGRIEEAKNASWRLLRIIFFTGLLLAPFFILIRDIMLVPFPLLSDETRLLSRQALLMISLVIWARGINFTNMNGILRSGGDTTGAAAIDIGMLWLFGVPLTIIGSLTGCPFWVIFGVVCLEEIIKTQVSIYRVRQYKWAKRLV